ncbi:MAG TPA: hypothetical protein VGC58_01450 [Candidatus Paceibacterota bacterium]
MEGPNLEALLKAELDPKMECLKEVWIAVQNLREVGEDIDSQTGSSTTSEEVSVMQGTLKDIMWRLQEETYTPGFTLGYSDKPRIELPVGIEKNFRGVYLALQSLRKIKLEDFKLEDEVEGVVFSLQEKKERTLIKSIKSIGSMVERLSQIVGALEENSKIMGYPGGLLVEYESKK